MYPSTITRFAPHNPVVRTAALRAGPIGSVTVPGSGTPWSLNVGYVCDRAAIGPSLVDGFSASTRSVGANRQAFNRGSMSLRGGDRMSSNKGRGNRRMSFSQMVFVGIAIFVILSFVLSLFAV